MDMQQLQFKFMEDILNEEERVRRKDGFLKKLILAPIILSGMIGFYNGIQDVSEEAVEHLKPGIKMVNSYSNFDY